MTIEQLNQLQDYIKENNLQDEPLVKAIMKEDTNEVENVFNYFNKFKGKYYVKQNDITTTIYHFSDCIKYDQKMWTDYINHSIKVIADIYTFRVDEKNNNISLNQEINKQLTLLFVGRFDALTEITEELYNKYLNIFKSAYVKNINYFNKLYE